jgi:hypothetical protein
LIRCQPAFSFTIFYLRPQRKQSLA